MILHIYAKFLENIFDGIKVIERTRLGYKNYKEAYFRKNVDGGIILFLCTLYDDALYLYQIS